ncbi:hypothetical protein P168DRAFT_279431 [Aspergillus campestris IBT 28561]|uniref:Uncharacterized protein n=1 Tax=Aspergillus campestris (strain IBT 28561) TaxID=1392248 RepID=A0A2I1DC56_ASPC2|nr:uncharacterized protein P168DRAFT_279431 [Aspergillus campestris IBT 28561]PKY07459.1 hypothetical protein P168DRAFT_279431 [Aspergillus campestris IBT 28561]
MPRSDCWTDEEIARVRRLRAENPRMTWNNIQQVCIDQFCSPVVVFVLSAGSPTTREDSNRGLRGSLATKSGAAAGQTAADKSSAPAAATTAGTAGARDAGAGAGSATSGAGAGGATAGADDATVGAADAAASSGAAATEPEADSQHGLANEEKESGSSRQSVTDAGSTPGQEGKRRASSSPDGHTAKRVKSAKDDSPERAATGEAVEGSGLVGSPGTESQEPASSVEQGPRSRGTSEPIPSVEDDLATQTARVAEDASSVEVIDLAESDVDRDTASESSDSSVWWGQTDDESSESDSELSPPSSTSTTLTTPTISAMHNSHTFSFEAATISFAIGGSIINTQAMTNTMPNPDMRRKIIRELAAYPRAGVTNGGSQATQAPSSSHAQKPKNKKKKTSQSQAAADPEIALPAMWAMIDAQIEQSRMLAAEIRKMRKLTTAILDQASQETQVKKEH